MPPTVPVYDRQRVNQQGLPNARFNVDTSLESFGGGQSVNQVAQAASNLVDTVNVVRKQADDLRAMEADTKLSELQTKIQMETSSLKGKNAVGAYDKAQADWTKGVEEIYKDLGNDFQRGTAKKFALNRWETLNKNIQSHMAKEQEVYAQDVLNGQIKASQNEMLMNFDKPDQHASSLERIELAIRKWGNDQGKPADLVESELAKVRTHSHGMVIHNMVSAQNDLGAKAYYDRFKDQITGEEADNIRELVEKGSVLGEGQRRSDVIMSTAKSQTEAYRMAAKEENPNIRKEIEAQLDHKYARQERIKNATEKAKFDAAWNKIQKGAPLDATMKVGLPPNLVKALEEGYRHKVEGTEPPLDVTTYYGLMRMAADPAQRSRFANMPLGPYFDKLDYQKRDQLIKLQTDILMGNEKTMQTLDGYLSDNQVIDGAIRQMGLDPTPKEKTPEADRVSQFRSAVDIEIKRLQEQKGRKATNDDLREVVSRLQPEFVLKKGRFGFLDTKKRAFEIKIEDVPKEAIESAKQILLKNNVPANDENILRLYRRSLSNNAGAK